MFNFVEDGEANFSGQDGYSPYIAFHFVWS